MPIAIPICGRKGTKRGGVVPPLPGLTPLSVTILDTVSFPPSEDTPSNTGSNPNVGGLGGPLSRLDDTAVLVRALHQSFVDMDQYLQADCADIAGESISAFYATTIIIIITTTTTTTIIIIIITNHCLYALLFTRLLLLGISGSTCVVALVTPTTILTAHVGDSRCVLYDNGHIISMTHDHKPETDKERVCSSPHTLHSCYDHITPILLLRSALLFNHILTSLTHSLHLSPYPYYNHQHYLRFALKWPEASWL